MILFVNISVLKFFAFTQIPKDFGHIVLGANAREWLHNTCKEEKEGLWFEMFKYKSTKDGHNGEKVV